MMFIKCLHKHQVNLFGGFRYSDSVYSWNSGHKTHKNQQFFLVFYYSSPEQRECCVSVTTGCLHPSAQLPAAHTAHSITDKP